MEKWQEELAEIRAIMKETSIRMAENVEESAKESAEAKKRSAELDKKIAETNKGLDKLKELVGNINDNRGYEAEEFFQSIFAQNLDFAGIKFDKMYPNWKIVGKENCEFDIVLVNGNSAAIIEVKNRIHPKFIEKLATTKLAQFRKYFKEIKDPKIYLGVAGFSFDDAVVKEADKYGIGIIRQKGDSYVVNTDSMKVY